MAFSLHFYDGLFPISIKDHRPYKINPFSVHDYGPNWCGSSLRPGAQCSNDPWVKGRLASITIKAEGLQLHVAPFL